MSYVGDIDSHIIWIIGIYSMVFLGSYVWHLGTMHAYMQHSTCSDYIWMYVLIISWFSLGFQPTDLQYLLIFYIQRRLLHQSMHWSKQNAGFETLLSATLLRLLLHGRTPVQDLLWLAGIQETIMTVTNPLHKYANLDENPTCVNVLSFIENHNLRALAVYRILGFGC